MPRCTEIRPDPLGELIHSPRPLDRNGDPQLVEYGKETGPTSNGGRTGGEGTERERREPPPQSQGEYRVNTAGSVT